MRLFLCGDVMIGRGVDQIMINPCPPILYENAIGSAMDYVRLAEKVNGPIPRPVSPSYIWGAALDELDFMQPDVRIVNLETSVTRSEDHVEKGINYRISPENANSLSAASIDCCVLANNHMLDWERSGLVDTLAALKQLQIETAGAGQNLAHAQAPAILHTNGGGRVLVFASAYASAGIPADWAAAENTPGVNLLPDLSKETALSICKNVTRLKGPADAAVFSIHWGGNWGYEVSREQQRFARALIDNSDISIVYGHSSHHAKGIEVYRNRLILYGCGDFLNDYEGIGGFEQYRSDLSLLYFADVDPMSGDLISLEMTPMQVKRFSLMRSAPDDAHWIGERLDRESQKFGVGVGWTADKRRLALISPNK